MTLTWARVIDVVLWYPLVGSYQLTGTRDVSNVVGDVVRGG